MFTLSDKKIFTSTLIPHLTMRNGWDQDETGHSAIVLDQFPGGCSKLPTQLTLIVFFTSK